MSQKKIQKSKKIRSPYFPIHPNFLVWTCPLPYCPLLARFASGCYIASGDFRAEGVSGMLPGYGMGTRHH